MPKMKKRAKGAKAAAAVVIRNKFRIGTRKNGKPAHTMSTEDLKAVLDDSNRTKFKNNAITVLRARGVKIRWPDKLVASETLADLAQDMQANTPA